MSTASGPGGSGAPGPSTIVGTVASSRPARRVPAMAFCISVSCSPMRSMGSRTICE